MFNGVRNRLEAFLGTPAGQRFMAVAEAEAAAKEKDVQRRRDLAAERAEILRRQREVRPELERLAEEAWAVAKKAKAEYEALRERAVDAARKSEREFLSNMDARRRAEAELRRSADPRILAAIEEADEALRTWSDTLRSLYRYRTEKASTWDGTDTWVKRAGNNQAGLDALKKAIEDAGAALERLALVAEPTEEAIARGTAAVKAAVAARQGDPPPIVMIDYDCHGQPVGRKP